MHSIHHKQKAIEAKWAPMKILDDGPQHQPTHVELVTAESMWERLSPGSLFYRSRVGRHLMVEHLLVKVVGRRSFVCVAYLTGDRGENTEALVNRGLFSRPPFWEAHQIHRWDGPIRSEIYYPSALVTALPLLVSYTRDFVQHEASQGWKTDRWMDDEDNPFALHAA